MNGRELIVATARTYLETPFHHQGRVAGVGVDCVGLVIGVAHALGLSSFDIQGYARQPDPITFRALLRQEMREKPFAQRLPGDVLSFAFINEQHLGIITVLEPLTIVHCWEKAGRCVEHALDIAWVRRIRGCWAYPLVDAWPA